MPAENGLIATGFFFLPSENIRFSNVSRGYEKRPVGGMKCVKQIFNTGFVQSRYLRQVLLCN